MFALPDRSQHHKRRMDLLAVKARDLGAKLTGHPPSTLLFAPSLMPSFPSALGFRVKYDYQPGKPFLHAGTRGKRRLLSRRGRATRTRYASDLDSTPPISVSRHLRHPLIRSTRCNVSLQHGNTTSILRATSKILPFRHLSACYSCQFWSLVRSVYTEQLLKTDR